MSAPTPRPLSEVFAELDEARLENAKLRAKLDKASTRANLLWDKVNYWAWIASRLDDDVVEARRQRAAAVAERDALSTLLRGMARRLADERRVNHASIEYYVQEDSRQRTEIAKLRGWVERLTARLAAKSDPSWRPGQKPILVSPGGAHSVHLTGTREHTVAECRDCPARTEGPWAEVDIWAWSHGEETFKPAVFRFAPDTPAAEGGEPRG